MQPSLWMVIRVWQSHVVCNYGIQCLLLGRSITLSQTSQPQLPALSTTLQAAPTAQLCSTTCLALNLYSIYCAHGVDYSKMTKYMASNIADFVCGTRRWLRGMPWRSPKACAIATFPSACATSSHLIPMRPRRHPGRACTVLQACKRNRRMWMFAFGKFDTMFRSTRHLCVKTPIDTPHKVPSLKPSNCHKPR